MLPVVMSVGAAETVLLTLDSALTVGVPDGIDVIVKDASTEAGVVVGMEETFGVVVAAAVPLPDTTVEDSKPLSTDESTPLSVVAVADAEVLVEDPVSVVVGELPKSLSKPPSRPSEPVLVVAAVEEVLTLVPGPVAPGTEVVEEEEVVVALGVVEGAAPRRSERRPSTRPSSVEVDVDEELEVVEVGEGDAVIMASSELEVVEVDVAWALEVLDELESLLESAGGIGEPVPSAFDGSTSPNSASKLASPESCLFSSAARLAATPLSALMFSLEYLYEAGPNLLLVISRLTCRGK